MKINEHGYWMNETAEGHEHDEGLAKALVEFFDDNNFYGNNLSLDILDVGCGDGYYTNYITDNSKSCVCTGIDGNPYTKELAGILCSVQDITVPFLYFSDWVLCLEVGEHIPERLQSKFLDNLYINNRFGIVLSWAIPGQGGDGHINCLDNIEVIRKVTSMGYEYDDKPSAKLRSKCSTYPNPCYWFRDTLMVFRKIINNGTISS